ncbi:DEAD/DEAH box helicase [Dactylosporangium vinaceum]|uniref:AAA domain-containing protein n=1 Tax=Dactylosporangium vinaceum TaxID=53362 RepID=A0ABV5LY76_9ACTN|nr:ATP-binding protein [Dactylosporangium vinaceum]
MLKFWQTVEMFSPQKVEKVDREQLVFAVRPGAPLPWEPGHELARRRLRPNQAWRHVVYLGIYRLDEVFAVLSRMLAPDPDSYDERPGGESAFAAFAVGEDGHAVLGSEVLSSCAWATGQVLAERLATDWVAAFEDASMAFGELWREAVTHEPAEPDGEFAERPPRLLGPEELAECLALAVAAAGTGDALSGAEIRISSQIVARRSADAVSGHEFLNSFIVADLALVAERVAKGGAGAALGEYLRPEAEIDTAGRVDVRARTDRVFAATAPDTVPAGRWPSDPEHALALSQQLAVNTALGLSAAGAGILGVNGPPGTGKTTMLRDLVAALVVERARRLAALPDPRQAFTGRQLRWKTGQYSRVVNVWRPELTGFEIVVASANNGAVQNVTDEIPAAAAIAGCWRERAAAAGYFPAIAGALLAPEGEEPVPGAAWALVAARLGNKANRSRFVNAFWYHTPEDDDDNPWTGLLTVLKSYEQTPPERSWARAAADFRDAEARVEAIRAERSEVYRTIRQRAELDAHLPSLAAAIRTAAARVETARARRAAAVEAEREQTAEAARQAQEQQRQAEQAARQRRAAAERTVAERRAEAERLTTGRRANAEQALRAAAAEAGRRWWAHAAHQQQRPDWWERLRTLGAADGKWSQQDRWLHGEVQTARQAQAAAQAGLDAAQRELDAALRAAADAERDLIEAARLLAAGVPVPDLTPEPLVAARRELARADQEVSAAARALSDAESAHHTARGRLAALDDRLTGLGAGLGRYYPDATWWSDRERREPAALWTDPEWNTARSELFLAALALHGAFLGHAAGDMRRNLQAAMDVVGGDAPRDIAEDAALAAWQSLFFVVPVVSTTFASYARLFGHLGQEALGWLLIDEAGQATPQNAAGALWRTKRAVVVGDPLQLEPVTMLPFRAEQAIRRELGVSEEWLTGRTSVQRLADRLTGLGTHLPTADGESTWVGVPLTVHRRCDQPMFDIVNAIAYDGLMINGTGTAARDRFNAEHPTLPESKWMDIAGATAQGHWIPDEGRQLDRILRALATLGLDMSEVMVIAPFRDIARRIAAQGRRYPGLTAGTVHTAQGKQADVVILVLGGNPDRPGARRWAAARPNLLNVAVSRAKRRLYVIGDREAWSAQRYFKTLAADLPFTRDSPAPPR